MNKFSQRVITSLAILIVFHAVATKAAQGIQFQFGGGLQLDQEVDLLNDVQVFRFPGNAAVEGADDGADVDSGAMAVLKTDPDLEAILEKATRFAKDGNYRVATELWQAVLDRSGDAMYSNNDVIYYSLADQVELVLARLPAEGLAVYRVQADADARAIIAAAETGQRPNVLSKVVGSYFLSSVGDDAAFELGCLSIDRYDFVGGLRLFERILQRYPDSDLPLDQIHLRQALCYGFLGRSKEATKAIAAAENALANQGSDGGVTMSQLKNSLDQLTVDSVATMTDQAVRMHLSGSRRYGVMPSLPSNIMSGDLAAIWQYYVEPKSKYLAASARGRTLAGRRSHGERALDTRNSEEEKLIDAWRDKQWRPAGHLLLDGDRVYFKSAADVTAWDRRRLANVSFGDSPQTQPNDWVAWRSVWRNAFAIDQTSQMLAIQRRQYGAYRRNRQASSVNSPDPLSISEVQFFGDQVYQQMSICAGVLYTIEGQPFDDRLPPTKQKRPPRNQYNVSVRRTRKNRLTAYSSKTGKLQWSLPRDRSLEQPKPTAVADAPNNSSASPWLEGGGFMSSPVSFGGLLLVPVNQGGAISIYCLDPNEQGRTVWKTYLCDEPETGAIPWSPIQLSVDGSDVFAATGLGAVFVLDAATGKVRFARRYAREGTTDPRIRVYNARQPRLVFDGWSSDVIIPWQHQLVCFASDSETIFAIDRGTGRAIWSCPMNPIGHKVDYVLGVKDGILYAAGETTIIAYDLNGEGRMVWGADDLFDGKTSLGRGMLTDDSIYMPVEGGIYQFSLNGKKGRADVLAKVGVDLGTDAPVGNLMSDGDRLWVLGANRLYALGKKLDEGE